MHNLVTNTACGDNALTTGVE